MHTSPLSSGRAATVIIHEILQVAFAATPYALAKRRCHSECASDSCSGPKPRPLRASHFQPPAKLIRDVYWAYASTMSQVVSISLQGVTVVQKGSRQGWILKRARYQQPLDTKTTASKRCQDLPHQCSPPCQQQHLMMPTVCVFGPGGSGAQG